MIEQYSEPQRSHFHGVPLSHQVSPSFLPTGHAARRWCRSRQRKSDKPCHDTQSNSRHVGSPLSLKGKGLYSLGSTVSGAGCKSLPSSFEPDVSEPLSNPPPERYLEFSSDMSGAVAASEVDCTSSGVSTVSSCAITTPGTAAIKRASETAKTDTHRSPSLITILGALCSAKVLHSIGNW